MQPLAVVPSEGHHTVCRAPPRNSQPNSRCRIPNLSLLSQMAIASFGIQEDKHLLGPCQVDLFATSLNHQLPYYISWRPDPFALSTDAFQGKWAGFLGYAFPPFALVGKCLQKVRREKASLLIVAPVWPSQTWYPFLLEYLVRSPVLILMYSDILHDPFGHRHPMVTQGQLQLAAWTVSGRATEQQEFQKGLPSLYCQGGAKEHHHPISQARRSGVAGVIEGKLILFM